ncbi:Protein of unknown function [Anaerorhabdus furcosa]|uniref:DUF1232 domain-containing protein n=1 Tax=Anaerorhabdus furcosa TaxID=118967 RepID=A0A1T4Q9Z5_9FIRM|nr:DUF1232 domain-containing protein [Anaerorhabdus furcosa]SKA00582.1 Protein of unknown function [Anaerorhabdus furcosa]
MKIKERLNQLRKDVELVFVILKDSNTPLYTKVLAYVTIGYALSPIDLVPDFIPFFGYLDDLLVLPLLVYLTIKSVPKTVLEECKKKTLVERPKKEWYYALPIFAIWVLILIWILKGFRMI